MYMYGTLLYYRSTCHVDSTVIEMDDFGYGS